MSDEQTRENGDYWHEMLKAVEAGKFSEVTQAYVHLIKCKMGIFWDKYYLIFYLFSSEILFSQFLSGFLWWVYDLTFVSNILILSMPVTRG